MIPELVIAREVRRMISADRRRRKMSESFVMTKRQADQNLERDLDKLKEMIRGMR